MLCSCCPSNIALKMHYDYITTHALFLFMTINSIMVLGIGNYNPQVFFEKKFNFLKKVYFLLKNLLLLNIDIEKYKNVFLYSTYKYKQYIKTIQLCVTITHIWFRTVLSIFVAVWSSIVVGLVDIGILMSGK